MIESRKSLIASLLVLISLSHSAAGAAIGFKPAVNYPVGTRPVAVAAGDFNGDGKIDLAVVNSGDATVAGDKVRHDAVVGHCRLFLVLQPDQDGAESYHFKGPLGEN